MFTKLSHTVSRPGQRAAFVFMIAALLLQAACVPFLGRGSDDSQATIAALQATINAPTATPVPTNTAQPTPVPPTVAPPTQAPPPTVAAQPAQPTAGAVQGPQAPANIEELITNSNVLLYEDVAGYPDVFRYVAAAMERLGFRRGDNYVDVGDAQGRLLTGMETGTAPNGKPWDLVIIASEVRDAIQGDYFQAIESLLSSSDTKVILEHYYLDDIHLGAAKPLLLRCGVDVREWNYGAINDLDLFIQDGNHPSVSELVKITGFRKSDTWAAYGDDVGDLMYLTGTGDAKFILGTRSPVSDDRQYGALVECIDGNLILQTTSTHNYLDESMVSLWANNIHYLLRKKHGG
jgi:hypothetical protein